MAVLTGFLIAALTVAAFLFLFFFKKTSWFNSLFFAVFILLALLFLFRKEWAFSWKMMARPAVYFLIDQSLSVRGVPANIPAGILSRHPVYYFADTLSERTNGLDREYTSLFDSIRALKTIAGNSARIFVVSDFNDNSSMKRNGFENVSNIFPVVLGKKAPGRDALSLFDVRFPDFIEAEDTTAFGVSVYSPRPVPAELRIRDGNKIFFRKKIHAGPGPREQDNDIQAGLGISGNRILTFEVFDAAGKPGGNPVKRSVDGISGMQKILLVCGRPSEEFVFLTRFLEKIRWLKTETVLLKTGRDVFRPSVLNGRFNAAILMDLSENQMNGAAVKKLLAMDLPVFYQTGVRDISEIVPIVRAFTNMRLIGGVSEKNFRYNGNDLILQTALNSDNDLIDAGPRARLFFGWGTWKWDFIRLKEDIAYNNYDSFWQNQVNWLLSSTVGSALPEKLNFTVGENHEHPAEGNYRYMTNGQEFILNVSHRPAEVSGIPPDIQTASGYRTNLIFADSPVSWPDKVREATGKELVETERTIHIDFTRSPIAFILMALSLVLFWIFRDREKIRR